jgi:hypothetical protein
MMAASPVSAPTGFAPGFSVVRGGSKRKVPPEKLKTSYRELPLDLTGGAYGEDEPHNDDPFESAPLECYSQAETLLYAGSVDWDVVFIRADIPEQYRQSWRSLVVPGAKTADIPDAHYRWIRRACNADPWRSKILSAIQEERKVDPTFGRPHSAWRNHEELHRTRFYEGSHPVAQGSVSTLCHSVSVSATLYWKQGDRPGPLTRKAARRTVRRCIVGCDGFRENFTGARLDEYQKSFQAGIALLVSTRWIPDANTKRNE